VTDRSLLYLYGIARADAPPAPAHLGGVDGQPVILVPVDGMAAIASPVGAAEYGEAALESRLADLQWVGERGVAHERVLNWFADRGPVIPLAPFSLHQDERRLRERLAPLRERFCAALQRLQGRREYGVKIWRTEEVASHLRELSPRIRALEEEMAAATPGRRFLLHKKLQAAERDELRAAVSAVARTAFQALERLADGAVNLPITAPQPAECARALVLHAAFLVKEEAFPAFQAGVASRAAELGALGFQWEFTGPWPAYHFVER
jgi:hypothetical protein